MFESVVVLSSVQLVLFTIIALSRLRQNGVEEEPFVKMRGIQIHRRARRANHRGIDSPLSLDGVIPGGGLVYIVPDGAVCLHCGPRCRQ